MRSFFQPHGDKPEETPESVLRALWFCAAGKPMSIARINGSPLPDIGTRLKMLDEAIIK